MATRRSTLKRVFGLVFGLGSAAAIAAEKSSPEEDALLRQIAERSKTDPLIGAKLGSKEVTQRLIAGMKTERGVHIESLLCALGAIAGYACQASVRAQATARGLAENALFVLVKTKNGGTYYFGDSLNKPLAESQYSVWSLAAAGAQKSGCKTPIDLDGVFKHVSETVGGAAFGKPRVPAEHTPHDLPLNYARSLWPALAPTIKKFCTNPEHWPVLLGLSIQDVIGMGKPVLDPCLALQIVMESAIPMSKVKLDAA
jgi:hypothetical protein